MTKSEFSVEQLIEISNRSKSLIRSNHFTILPGIWDQSSFYFETSLDGKRIGAF